MKRVLMLLVSVICFALYGCSNDGASSNQSESSSDYNPFAQMELGDGETMEANFGYGLCNPPTNNCFEYQDEITLDFFIENAAQEVDFGMILYVNGVLQEYYYENEAEKQTMAHIVVDQNEKKEFSVTFSPVAGKNDEIFCLSYAVMFHPDFAPQSSTVSFGNNYRISAMSFPITNAPSKCAVQKTLCYNGMENIPKDIESEYYILDESGNMTTNLLLETTLIRVEKSNSSDVKEDESPNALTKNDSVNLTLLGGPQESKWRISMYCNHGLVSAFDGTSYIDMQASSDKMSTYTVPMSVIGDVAQQYSSVYFIASPIGSNGESYPIKSHSFVYVNE